MVQSGVPHTKLLPKINDLFVGCVVIRRGFEPLTLGLGILRSIQLN